MQVLEGGGGERDPNRLTRHDAAARHRNVARVPTADTGCLRADGLPLAFRMLADEIRGSSRIWRCAIRCGLGRRRRWRHWRDLEVTSTASRERGIQSVLEGSASNHHSLVFSGTSSIPRKSALRAHKGQTRIPRLQHPFISRSKPAIAWLAAGWWQRLGG